MHTRLTKIKIRSDKVEEVAVYRDRVAPLVSQFPGLRHWIGLLDDDGNCVIITTFDNKADADASLATSSEIWDQVSDLLEGPPVIHEYDTIHFHSF